VALRTSRLKQPNRVIAIQILVACATVGSVLGIGGAVFAVVLVIALLAFSAAVLTAVHAYREGRAIQIGAFATVCAVLAAFTLLQACPLPVALLRVIAPNNEDIWARALLPIGGAAPRFAPISLDPGATCAEALKWATYGAVYYAAKGIAETRTARFGLSLVFVSGVAVAAATIGHGLLGLTSVWGIYKPNFLVASWHVGPLLNPNNLAGYVNLAIMCGLGLLLSERPSPLKVLVAAGVALLVAVAVISASRAGFVLLPVGVVALFLLQQRSRRGLSLREPTTYLGLIALGSGLVLALIGSTEQTWKELYDKNLEKLEMVVWARPMIRDHTWFGVGRGSFESVFPAYHLGPNNHVYAHIENFAAQWITEWGVPVGLATIVALAIELRPSAAARGISARAARIGVAMLLVQNFFDLAFEMLGVCVAVAVVLASSRTASRAPDGPRPRIARAAAASFACVAAVASFVAASAFGWHPVAPERASLHDESQRFSDQLAEHASDLRAKLVTAIRRHPADPYFPLLGATLAFRVHDQNPIPWLQRALERGEGNSRAHLLLAEVLAAMGARSQALIELRMAAEIEPTLVPLTAQYALENTSNFSHLLYAVPDGPLGAQMFDALANLSKATAPELSERLDAAAIERADVVVGPHRRAAERLLLVISSPDDKPCGSKEDCIAVAEKHIAALERIAPSSIEAPRLRAMLFLRTDQSAKAEAVLLEACGRVTERVMCLSQRAEIEASRGDLVAFDTTGRELLSESCMEARRCADTATWLGDIRGRFGHWSAASLLYERAAREDPTDARWIKAAEAASRAGAHARAADDFERVARRGGGGAELKERIEGERAKAARGLLDQ
jgi:hypothetical protein